MNICQLQWLSNHLSGEKSMAALGIRICMLLVFSVMLLQNHAKAVSVSYDDRALKLDGQRRMLISGSIHYPRSTPTVSAFDIPYLNLTSKCIKLP